MIEVLLGISKQDTRGNFVLGWLWLVREVSGGRRQQQIVFPLWATKNELLLANETKFQGRLRVFSFPIGAKVNGCFSPVCLLKIEIWLADAGIPGSAATTNTLSPIQNTRASKANWFWIGSFFSFSFWFETSFTFSAPSPLVHQSILSTYGIYSRIVKVCCVVFCCFVVCCVNTSLP